MSDETSSELWINVKGTLPLLIAWMITDSVVCRAQRTQASNRDNEWLELKQAIAEKSDVEADRQRLIYLGPFCRCIV